VGDSSQLTQPAEAGYPGLSLPVYEQPNEASSTIQTWDRRSEWAQHRLRGPALIMDMFGSMACSLSAMAMIMPYVPILSSEHCMPHSTYT
jgi:hypothetical protein